MTDHILEKIFLFVKHSSGLFSAKLSQPQELSLNHEKKITRYARYDTYFLEPITVTFHVLSITITVNFSGCLALARKKNQ